METKQLDIKALHDSMKARNDNALPPSRFSVGYHENDIYSLLGQCYKAEVIKRVPPQNYISAGEEMKNCLHLAARWLCDDHKRPGLLLFGDVGTGKSTLLYAMRTLINRVCQREQDGQGRIEQVLDEPFPISVVKAKQIVSDFQLNRARYDLMTRVALLGIDELGVESIESKQYGNVSEPIIDLLAERYDRQLCTIVSTNMSMTEIRERYGVRILDRFNEMFATIAFTGKSYRK